MPQADDFILKGRALEAQIERFFVESGYQTQRNQKLEGRSGALHEVDVLADKSDGVTTFKVLVECKAWNRPIEKDVVSKISYVMTEVGANKGIIVSLEGWRSGAERAASQLGIELWDAFDLEKKLGKVVVADLKRAGASRHARGLAPVVTRQAAWLTLDRQRTGMFAKESLGWGALIWLPVFLFELRTTFTERKAFRKGRVESRVVFNAYDGLNGSLLASFLETPDASEVEGRLFLQPLVTERKVIGEITKARAKLGQLVSEAARVRQLAKLTSLGVPLPAETVSVDGTEELYWPYYVGLLEKRGQQRLAAVGAVGGQPVPHVSQILTENLRYVVDALDGADSIDEPAVNPTV